MYIKFNDSKNMLECSVITNLSIATLKFEDNVVVDTSGFHAYLDVKGEYDIGGESYEGFTTIYRNDETTAEYNGYQLSNDGSIYVDPEPEPENESLTATELTEEEKQEKERQEKISEILSKIEEYKVELSETDYIFIKGYEASLVGELITEYDYGAIHLERESIRNKINELEAELELLSYQTEEE